MRSRTPVVDALQRRQREAREPCARCADLLAALEAAEHFLSLLWLSLQLLRERGPRAVKLARVLTRTRAAIRRAKP